MSITVADCLKLPSLREAKVLGGTGGIDRDVSCVSVLEHVDLLMLKREGFFLGNQIIISALVSIKDDVEAQCNLIRLLSESGEVGLILYYVGIFIADVDARLIRLADELDFPLIMMPPYRYHHRYSDFISETMSAIVDDQRQETNIVPGIINQIAHLGPHKHNIETALRILGDRLRCSLLLADRNGNICAFAPWPFGAEWDASDLNAIVELRLKEPYWDESDAPIEMYINGMNTQIYCTTLDIEKQKGFFLAGIDESGKLNTAYLSQIVETLQLFSTIWDDSFGIGDTDALLRAILNNRPGEMKLIAHTLHIDMASFDTVWILWEKKESGYDTKNNAEWLSMKLAAFLKGNKKTALVDVYEDYVVAFIDSKSNPFVEFSKEFIDEVRCLKQVDLVLFHSLWQEHESTEEICDSFLLMEANIKTACIVYPHQSIFTQHELRFVQTCRGVLESGEMELKKATKILAPLLQDEAGKDVLDTLMVFLLDCQGNIPETSNQLFVHKNTVKYRLKKSERLLDLDLLKMPEIMNLYTALAITRILS